MEVEEERAAGLCLEHGDGWPPWVASRLARKLVMQTGEAQKVKRRDWHRAWAPVPVAGQLRPEASFQGFFQWPEANGFFGKGSGCMRQCLAHAFRRVAINEQGGVVVTQTKTTGSEVIHGLCQLAHLAAGIVAGIHQQLLMALHQFLCGGP